MESHQQTAIRLGQKIDQLLQHAIRRREFQSIETDERTPDGRYNSDAVDDEINVNFDSESIKAKERRWPK